MAVSDGNLDDIWSDKLTGSPTDELNTEYLGHDRVFSHSYVLNFDKTRTFAHLAKFLARQQKKEMRGDVRKVSYMC
jgi:hypothetical protein